MKQGLALCLSIALAAAPAVAASAAERAADPPLVVNGDVSLTTADFQAYLEKVPENLRTEFSASMERVSKTVESLWLQRMVARKARAEGLVDDPVVAERLRQAQEQVLFEAYLRKVEKELKYPDLLPRAREIYASDKERFTVPGRVHVQHILVDTKCRSRDEALKRAKEIRSEVLASKEDFTLIAHRVSDDPTRDKNGGDLGLVAPTLFEEPFRKAIAKLEKPGEVSEPVETRYGFHIVRFVKREPGRVKPFEEVKDEIVQAEKQKILDAARARVVEAVRADPGNRLHIDNLEAVVEKARREMAAAPASAETQTR
jgi:peptidyl-prolyl cis-trans isomerase C